MCCTVLQRVDLNVLEFTTNVCRSVLQCVAVCRSVLQCVAVCCSVLQCDDVDVLKFTTKVCSSVLQYFDIGAFAKRCSTLRQ